VLLYELLCGDLPFQYSDASSLFPNTDQAIFFPPELRLSKACQHFVRSLLEPSQEKRLGSQGADQVKGHSFFQGIDWKVAASKGLEPPLLPQDNNSNALDKDSFNADTEETDDFRTFTIYDSYLNRQVCSHGDFLVTFVLTELTCASRN
jgi:serum/glucocorticoid-regulated kinase 2